MKISVYEVQSGPFRWLLRISGWTCLVMGIGVIFAGSNSPFASIYAIENPILMGVILVVLDLLLPDPARDRRKAKRKLKKLYTAVCNALPSNADAFNAAKNMGSSIRQENEIRMYEYAAKAFFNRVPTKEALRYIHHLNPQASYKICMELVEAAKKTAGK